MLHFCRTASILAVVTAACVSGAAAQTDKFKITSEEKAACQADAILFCSAAFPNEDLLLTCLRANLADLSVECRKTFKAGLRRRHLL